MRLTSPLSVLIPLATACTGANEAADVVTMPPALLFGEPLPQQICTPTLGLSEVTATAQVVGTGTAASCTETALRDAITQGGAIVFNCGPAPHTITLAATLEVTVDTVIDGGGLITLSGGDSVRILTIDTGDFEAQGPSLTVQRLRLSAGSAPLDHVLQRPWVGTASACVPPDAGPDIHWEGGGGAIFHRGGSVRLIQCLVENNTAALVGPDVAGGAIYGYGARAETTVEQSIIRNNRASNGGAIGGLFSAITISNSALINNRATGCEANYEQPNPNGQGTLQYGSGGNGGAIYLDGAGRTLSLCGSRLASNQGNALGGAIFRVSYGRVYDFDSHTVVPANPEPTIIDRCSIRENLLDDREDNGIASNGGGLFLMGTRVTMNGSLLANNRSRIFAGAFIADHDMTSAAASFEFVNVSVVGNRTWPQADWTTRGVGGGLVAEGALLTGSLVNCTIYDNEAQFAAGIWGVTELTVRNSIIANRGDNSWVALNCAAHDPATIAPGTGGPNLQWVLGADEHSETPEDPWCTLDTVRANPSFGALADNGGFTQTVMPQAGSPALGAGLDCPATDARGQPRPTTGCTLGAVEAL